ncbi:MAG: sodium:solute symporter [Ruminococcaceae bacterium]|nr:sodium:solute symporter [Oscillospiraceae bacterium]
MFIKVALLVVFFAVMILVGFLCRRQADGVGGFVLGGRNVGPWLTAFAYGTSYFSAVIFIGYAGQFGWKYGVSATWIGIGNAIIGSLLAWVILGRRTRLMTQHIDSKTMPDFFGIRFNSKALKTVASVIVFVFLIPYTASLYNGLARLFDSAFPKIDYTTCVIIMSVLTCIYVVVGGYMATAVNDFIQGIIMLAGIVIVIAAVLNSQGGFMEAMRSLSEITAESNPELSGAFTSFLGPEPLALFGVVILTSLGTWGLPQMIGKFYAIKNESAISKGTIISTIFAIIVAGGCYFMGGFGRLFADKISYVADGVTPQYDSIVPAMLSGLPDIVVAIVIMLVLSASMSTLSSLVLTSSSTLTLDMIVPAVEKGEKKVSQKKQMLVIRILIVFFVAVSAAIAIIQAKSSVTFIAQLMGISWGALAGAFLAPFLYGLYWKKTTKAAVWVSFISGVGIMVANMICNFAGVTFISPYFSSPINAGMLAMVVGLVIVPVVSLITKKPDAAEMDKIFSCYNREVTVSAKTSLTEK